MRTVKPCGCCFGFFQGSLRVLRLGAGRRSGRASRRAILAAAMAALLLISAVPTASAAYWGVTSGDWSTPSNLNGGVPASTDTAEVVDGGTATISSAGEVAHVLQLGDSSDWFGAVNMIGGTPTVGDVEFLGSGASSGTFTQTSGQNTTFNLGLSGTGEYVLIGGTLTVNGGFANGGIVDGASGAATLNVNGFVDLSRSAWQNYSRWTVNMGSWPGCRAMRTWTAGWTSTICRSCWPTTTRPSARWGLPPCRSRPARLCSPSLWSDCSATVGDGGEFDLFQRMLWFFWR